MARSRPEYPRALSAAVSCRIWAKLRGFDPVMVGLEAK